MKKLIFLLTIMISISCANPENKAVDTADIVKISKDFQEAYISRLGNGKSMDFRRIRTVLNSNGSALAVQTEEQVNTDRGWDLVLLKCQIIRFLCHLI